MPKELKCELGTISELIHHGIIPNKDTIKSRIHDHNIDPDFCGDPAEFKPEDDCSSCLDSATLKAAFQQKCTGLKSCEFSINNYLQK